MTHTNLKRLVWLVILFICGCGTVATIPPTIAKENVDQVIKDCKTAKGISSFMSIECGRVAVSYIDCLKSGKDHDSCNIAIQSSYKISSNQSATLEPIKNSLPKTNQLSSIQISSTPPDSDGFIVINIKSIKDIQTLTVNGEEQNSSINGVYTIKKFALMGRPTTYTVVATDTQGKKDSQTLTVTRTVAKTQAVFEELSPSKIKERPKRDAVAIVIGIQDYKRLPKADYASTDAQAFYDYAVRALGVPEENVKLLLDDSADNVEIYKAFQSWLPFKVKKGKTDVYVFYSGHGLPSADGKSLYFLPVGADRDLIAKTAISQKEIVDALKAAQPKSVTMFIDSCYSGQIRTGETLLASARPVVLTVQETAYPPDFTVITASASDQIASSSPDLKHGIFSYYLMKGLEGEADENKDGTITIGKLQSYLAERVPRFAMTMSRKQEPQLTGDANRVLVAR
jgi:hypothetical protein